MAEVLRLAINCVGGRLALDRAGDREFRRLVIGAIEVAPIEILVVAQRGSSQIMMIMQSSSARSFGRISSARQSTMASPVAA